MNRMTGTLRGRISPRTAIALAVGLVLGAPSAWATIQFMNDGAVQNSHGGFDLPSQGTCPAGALQGYTGIDIRPECVALRLNIVQASCVSPNYSWTTSGVCNDLVNTTQTTCQAEPDRLWNPGTGICSVVMAYDDRNDVVCALHGGTWVTAGTCTGSWVFPPRSDYNPPLLTGTGPGDQCLRCHNTRTQYNGPRVRDTEDTMFMGHKNMSRKVTPGTPWGGPPFHCTLSPYTTEEACYDGGGNWVPEEPYPSDDSGNVFDWTNGKITVAGTSYDLTWIYADWIAPRPRAIYKAPASTTQVCSDPRYSTATCVTNGGTLLFNAGASYSCARCHTTGWTSDAAINTNPPSSIESKEPEASFPGLTWDRTTDSGPDKVNLSGGVSGDPNKYSSWDTYGITCTRCHSSAIDTTTGNTSTPPQYSAPIGMSSHHSNMTAPDASNGVCSNTQWTAEAQCVSGGGEWLTACSVNPTPAICQITAADSGACGTAGGTWTDAPFCSNAYYTDSTSCTANGFAWTLGWCAGAAPTGSPLTCPAGLTLRLNGTQASCQVGGGTWSFAKCSIAGVCNKGTCSNTIYPNQVSCTDHGGTWTGYADATSCATAGGQFRYATDVIRCEDASGRWTGNNSNRGQLITRLCMDCHRQETAGLPYGATSTNGVTVDYTNTDPAGQLKVGQYHSTITFLSHPQGNQFLNSPHAKFATGATTTGGGRFPLIGTGRFNLVMTGEYKSFFMAEAEAANTGNGCTGCHEVHTSTVAGENPFRERCTDCHAGANKKDLTTINHLWGMGTPMEHAATDEASACQSCHMPGGTHLFRINPDVGYSTFPVAAALGTTAALNANTAPDGTYASAAWVDVDAACGQCHGGGTSYRQTTGSITPPSAVVTVASAAGFLVGERVRITGAGSYEYDEQGSDRGDFDSYIKAVDTATNQITLVGPPPIAAIGKTVTQNPRSQIQPGLLAPYYTKAQLAIVARGMHGSSGLNYGVTFSTSITGLTVAVDATVDCGVDASGVPVACPTFTYDWNWGDGSPRGFSDPGSHTYLVAGKYDITLVVRKGGLQVGAPVTRGVTLVAPDLPPIAAGTCTWTADTWTMQLVDSSTDAPNPPPHVVVDWGDGTRSSVVAGGTISRAYTRVGSFTVRLTASDAKGQSSTVSCTGVNPAVPAYFTVGGTVRTSGGAAIPSALVTLKKRLPNGTYAAIKSTSTSATGTYTFGNLIKPARYAIAVAKTGYAFGPAPEFSVGPDATIDISALPPSGLSLRPKGMDDAN